MPRTETSHILVIDDRPEELRLLLQLLRAEGFRLSLSTDPHQGLQRAEALAPDLILLDVHMPRMSGFALCRRLREMTPTRRTPIIFLTSSASPEARLEGLSLGGVDYVLKPFIAEEVLARIRIHLQLTWREPESTPSEPASSTLTPDQVILHAATRLIAQNLDDLPPLAGIAQLVGTYDKKLSAIFREQLGTTVFAYIREERLRKSQELLIHSNLSMQDIAVMVGFHNASNFATAFRERTGMTPSEFRKQSTVR
jgi:CheY-like chemotaxis protein